MYCSIDFSSRRRAARRVLALSRHAHLNAHVQSERLHMQVRAAILTRQSIRAFLADPVPREMLEDILTYARFAPSGSNMQPWSVYVVQGEPLRSIAARATAAFEAGIGYQPEWHYYPQAIPEPWSARRRECGFGLYEHLGVARGDRAASARHEANNYRFFCAPAARFFGIDRRLERGSWID
jgi:nitroreductase